MSVFICRDCAAVVGVYGSTDQKSWTAKRAKMWPWCDAVQKAVQNVQKAGPGPVMGLNPSTKASCWESQFFLWTADPDWVAAKKKGIVTREKCQHAAHPL